MIPVVDIASYVEASISCSGDPSRVKENPTVKETVRLLHDAVGEHGFCFLVNHGLPQSMLEKVQSSAKTFFELPESTKQNYARPVERNHGWVAPERERLNPDRPHADLKEAFNFSPCEEGSWPTDEVPEMGNSFNAIFRQCHQLTGYVLDLLGLALEFEDHLFLRKCHQLIGQKGNYTSMRSLYYPPTANLKEGQIQCGEHSDYGTITLLFQDDTGGLQVLGKDGQYHDVTPVPGAVLVNIGDLMQRWTADRYPSTKHRVVIPKQATESGRARQSLAYFTIADDDTVINCLDGSNTYPPITSHDYLMERFRDAYQGQPGGY